MGRSGSLKIVITNTILRRGSKDNSEQLSKYECAKPGTVVYRGSKDQGLEISWDLDLRDARAAGTCSSSDPAQCVRRHTYPNSCGQGRIPSIAAHELKKLFRKALLGKMEIIGECKPRWASIYLLMVSL